jgi:hypothetical protein
MTHLIVALVRLSIWHGTLSAVSTVASTSATVTALRDTVSVQCKPLSSPSRIERALVVVRVDGTLSRKPQPLAIIVREAHQNAREMELQFSSSNTSSTCSVPRQAAELSLVGNQSSLRLEIGSPSKSVQVAVVGPATDTIAFATITKGKSRVLTWKSRP